MSTRKALAPVMGLLVLGLSTIVSADTVTATFQGVSPGRDVAYSYDGGATFVSSVAGEFNWLRTGGTHQGAPDGRFISFCIELTQSVGYTSYTFDVVDLALAPEPGGSGVGPGGMGIGKANLVSELWGRHFGEIEDANLTLEREKAAAFQLAVWEIVYDGELDLAGGSFRAAYPAGPKPIYLSTAESWLASLNGQGPREPLAGLTNPRAQDQVVTLVPLPAASWAGLTLLGVMGAVRVWRKRRQA